jgi:hypothetical protein
MQLYTILFPRNSFIVPAVVSLSFWVGSLFCFQKEDRENSSLRFSREQQTDFPTVSSELSLTFNASYINVLLEYGRS